MRRCAWRGTLRSRRSTLVGTGGQFRLRYTIGAALRGRCVSTACRRVTLLCRSGSSDAARRRIARRWDAARGGAAGSVLGSPAAGAPWRQVGNRRVVLAAVSVAAAANPRPPAAVGARRAGHERCRAGRPAARVPAHFGVRVDEQHRVPRLPPARGRPPHPGRDAARRAPRDVRWPGVEECEMPAASGPVSAGPSS